MWNSPTEENDLIGFFPKTDRNFHESSMRNLPASILDLFLGLICNWQLPGALHEVQSERTRIPRESVKY